MKQARSASERSLEIIPPMHARRLLGLNVAALTIAALTLLAVVIWSFYDARMDARRQAAQQSENVAIAVEGEITLLFKQYNALIRVAKTAVEAPDFASRDPEIRSSLFRKMSGLGPPGSRVAVIDRTGRYVYHSGIPGAETMDGSARPQFTVHKDRSDVGLYISPPMASLSDGKPMLGISRRIDAPDGSFTGAAVTRIELSRFEEFFDKLDLGRQGIVALYSTDGRMIARRPTDPANIGRVFPSVAQRQAGTFSVTSPVDGITRLYSVRKLQDYPFIVTVGQAHSDFYAGWYQKLGLFGSVFAVLVTCIGLVGARSVKLAQAQRQAEREAARANADRVSAYERLQVVFQHSHDSNLVAHRRADGEIVYETVNPVWEQLTGVRSDDAIGRTPMDCLPRALATQVMENWRACLDTRQVQTFDFKSPDGREWEAKLVPVLNDAGEADRLIASARDVTERVRMEEELGRRVDEAVADREAALVAASAAERLRTLGELASGIAHDFGNVLQTLSGCVSLVEKRTDDPGLKRIARIASNATERGASITRRLLAFSRHDQLNPEPIEVRELFLDVCDLMHHTLGSASK